MTLEEVKDAIRCGARVALLVRHAERPKIDPDDPTFGDSLALTYEGCRTARKLGTLLADFREEVQFASSPLMRARMTASLVAEGMGVEGADVPTDGRLGNESFYYSDAAEVLEVFKPENFFPACVEYFTTGEQRGFKNLYAATDAFEAWIDETQKNRFYVIATHDLYVAAFLTARKVGMFARENWVRFLDAGAVVTYPDGTRRYALVRTGLSKGIVGVVRPKISGVVFDFGGVMTTSTMPERVRTCVAELGLSWADLEQGFARYRRLMDGGFITMDQMYDLIWADADTAVTPEQRRRVYEEDYASFLDGYRNMATLEWMRELKASGYRIGILSNMSHEFSLRFKETFPEFIEVADAMVLSGDEAMYKPQKRIYDLLSERIGLPPESLCFLDDSDPNCEGARRAGWHAIQFSDVDQARRDFKAIVG